VASDDGCSVKREMPAELFRVHLRYVITMMQQSSAAHCTLISLLMCIAAFVCPCECVFLVCVCVSLSVFSVCVFYLLCVTVCVYELLCMCVFLSIHLSDVLCCVSITFSRAEGCVTQDLPASSRGFADRILRERGRGTDRGR
jgi:hypothetical protein